MNKKGFASDNNSGVSREILTAIHDANNGHTIAYGDDIYTKTAIWDMKEIFGHDCEIFFVFIGTAANTLGLEAITNTWNSVICAETSHIHVDECGAPEKITGCKLLSVPTENGKLSIGAIEKHIHGFGFEHHSQPRVISITQSTEMGTVYSIEEIKSLADYAHRNGLLLHMDGARISNAAVSLNCSFKEMTADAGVDVLSFGGTKNGMMYGEAVIFFDSSFAKDFKYIRKQGMQLSSKMRFISVQFSAFLRDGLWRKNALHANRMARLLHEKVRLIPGVEITQEVQSNGVFAKIPKAIIPELQKHYAFYVWDEAEGEVRWMTSFDTKEDEIIGFAGILRDLMENAP